MWVFKFVYKFVKYNLKFSRRRFPVRRLEKINFSDIPPIDLSLLYLMGYESWVWVMDWCAQSCPISLGTNSSWYHGATVIRNHSIVEDALANRVLLPVCREKSHMLRELDCSLTNFSWTRSATLSSMLRLSLPSVNILSKIDTAPRLPARLETFTDPVDLS